MSDKNIDPIRQQLAGDIKRARIRVGLSQEALAVAAKVDRTYVSQLERSVANPSVEVLERLAVALGVRLVLKFIAIDEDDEK